MGSSSEIAGAAVGPASFDDESPEHGWGARRPSSIRAFSGDRSPMVESPNRGRSSTWQPKPRATRGHEPASTPQKASTARRTQEVGHDRGKGLELRAKMGRGETSPPKD